MNRIEELAVSRGRHTKWKEGLVVGLISGGLFGATLLAQSFDAGDCSGPDCLISGDEMRAAWGAIGAAGVPVAYNWLLGVGSGV